MRARSRCIRALAGFERVTLAPGEKRTVTIALKASQLGYWDSVTGKMTVETGPVGLMVGESSSGIKLTKTISVN